MSAIDINLPDAIDHMEMLAIAARRCDEPFDFELRCIHPTTKAVRSMRYNPFRIDHRKSALDYARNLNGQGYNIYTNVNPIKPGGNPQQASRDNEIIAATHLFLDADDEGVADHIITRSSIPIDFMVTTGTVPYLRAHFYFALEKPKYELGPWQSAMTNLISNYGCDPSAKNPSRIMRLAGFVSYPSEKKIRRGYVEEVVTLTLHV